MAATWVHWKKQRACESIGWTRRTSFSAPEFTKKRNQLLLFFWHITNRDYSADKYKRLNPAKKAKLWQLRNPTRTPGTGPTRRDRNSFVASTSTTSSTTGKHQSEDIADKDEKPSDDSGSRNRDNLVLGHQVHQRSKEQDTWRVDPNHVTRDKTITWSLETLRTIHIDLDQRRTVKNISYKINDPNYETKLELDSHADTCVLGRDALIVLDFQRPINVVGYDESLGTKTYATVSGITSLKSSSGCTWCIFHNHVPFGWRQP